MRDPILRTVRTLHSYAEQARYYVAHIDAEWIQLGWVRLINDAVKPVYALDGDRGQPVILISERDPRRVRVTEIRPDCILATEEECYGKR